MIAVTVRQKNDKLLFYNHRSDYSSSNTN